MSVLLSRRLRLHWASREPSAVSLVNDVWAFIAVFTPELADAGDPEWGSYPAEPVRLDREWSDSAPALRAA